MRSPSRRNASCRSIARTVSLQRVGGDRPFVCCVIEHRREAKENLSHRCAFQPWQLLRSAVAIASLMVSARMRGEPLAGRRASSLTKVTPCCRVISNSGKSGNNSAKRRAAYCRAAELAKGERWSERGGLRELESDRLWPAPRIPRVSGLDASKHTACASSATSRAVRSGRRLLGSFWEGHRDRCVQHLRRRYGHCYLPCSP